MFERLTDRARKVLELAKQEAMRSDYDHVQTEHILLGIIAEGEGMGARMLIALGVEFDVLRRELRNLLQKNSKNTTVRLREKAVIKHAVEEARALQHTYCRH